jgi:hypothetical protein
MTGVSATEAARNFVPQTSTENRKWRTTWPTDTVATSVARSTFSWARIQPNTYLPFSTQKGSRSASVVHAEANLSVHWPEASNVAPVGTAPITNAPSKTLWSTIGTESAGPAAIPVGWRVLAVQPIDVRPVTASAASLGGCGISKSVPSHEVIVLRSIQILPIGQS